MISCLFLCCLVALAAANPAPFAKDSIIPNTNHGVHQDILNGENALYGNFNFMLSLRLNGNHICGATLLSSSRAITAGHCVERGSPLSIQAGQLNLNSSSGHEVTRPVKQIIKHPNYDPEHLWKNNIAILKFDPIRSGQYIESIPMITDPNDDLTKMTCWMAGWGHTSTRFENSDVLHYTLVTPMANSECKNLIRTLDPGEVCVKNLEKEVSTCDGDVGSPLTCETANGEKLAGVAALATESCEGPGLSVFTRVAKYKDWIAENL